MTFPDSGMHSVHGVPSEVKILLDEGVVQGGDPVSTLDYLDSDEEDGDVQKLLAAAADAPEPEADVTKITFLQTFSQHNCEEEDLWNEAGSNLEEFLPTKSDVNDVVPGQEEWNTDMAPGDPFFVGDTDADHLTVGEAVCYFMELRRAQHWSRPAFDRSTGLDFWTAALAERIDQAVGVSSTCYVASGSVAYTRPPAKDEEPPW
ncbi:hypothetical protein CYMTET_9462 [Cymbomonas tetramitiformis]|uniref:Uncharacterized protein n=1 Tax=Cymbomonas tetramitiformis TaxID=36881 RepID=A0AAE0GSQ7_9CHLO|nr:hypothetical protein CYMTET_9462 [Cymbomonas tetramitiformis]